MPLVSKTFGDIITFTRATTGSATFVGSNGLIQVAAPSAPRFDYDPVTLAAKGLLIEEQRANLLTYSEDLTNAAWSTATGFVTVSGDVAVAPDGTTTADKIVSTAATSYGMRTPIYTSTAATYTQSAFCKADGFNYVKFVWNATQNATDYAVFNLTNGTITGGTYTSASITSFGNGWYRCSITSTLAAVSNYSYIWLSDGTLSRISGVAGDGTSGILVWGAQVELGSFPTSYIPTVASQVTRSADDALVNTLSPWYNATTGSVYAEFTPFEAGTGSESVWQFLLDSSNRRTAYLNTSNRAGLIETSGGLTQANILTATNSIVVSATNKTAICYATNDFAISANGQAVVTHTLGNVAVGINALKLGSGAGVTNYLNGWLRRFTYYPRRLSNAELQAITA